MKDGIHIKRDISKAATGAKKPKMRSGVFTGIIAGAVIVVLAAGAAVAGFYVNKLDTIYPNVSIGGIELSGMTVDEAKKVLTDSGYENEVSNISVTVNFPDGKGMTITGEAAGISLPADKAAELAYNYGKDGSFLTNEMDFVKSLFTKYELSQSGAVKINEDYVRGIVEDFTQAFNDSIMNDAYTVTADSIKITKGNGNTLADAEALYDLVVTGLNDSVAKSEPIQLEYSVGTSGGADIDLQSIYDTVFTEPVSAIYDMQTRQVTQSVTGVSFDITAAQKALNAAQTGSTVTIPLLLSEPEVTTEALQSLIFRDILSEKKTYVSGTSNRIHNVILAAKAANGKILNPGETFSYNETLGERTTAKGYREAGAYVGGQVVLEVGGGICQLSSTLYYCALYADLEVVERSNHMFIVTYLPLGTDATVNWGTVDFKFKNSTEYPMKLECIYEDGYLTVRLHGTKTGTNTVKVDSVVISSTDFETIKKEDPSVAAGTTKEESSGHKGYVVDTYKYIYDADGNLLSKTFIARNKYRVQDKVILVPVGTLTVPSPSPSPTPSATDSPTVSDTSPSPSDTATPTVSDASPSPTPSDTATPTGSDISPST